MNSFEENEATVSKRRVKVSEFLIDKPIGNNQFKTLKCSMYRYVENSDVIVPSQNTEKELQHYRNALLSVEKKLANENFLNKAPKEVVEKERKKKTDFEEKITLLEQTNKEQCY